MKIITCALFVLLIVKLDAQQVSTNGELDKLKLKSVYFLGTGSVVTVVGAALTGAGTHNLKHGVEWGGLIGNPYKTDYRPSGRILLSCGVPLFAGGLALIASGIYFQRKYVNERKQLVLTTGYLENGNIGMALNF